MKTVYWFFGVMIILVVGAAVLNYIDANAPIQQSATQIQLQEEVIQAINAAREENGIVALEVSESLSKSAIETASKVLVLKDTFRKTYGSRTNKETGRETTRFFVAGKDSADAVHTLLQESLSNKVLLNANQSSIGVGVHEVKLRGEDTYYFAVFVE